LYWSRALECARRKLLYSFRRDFAVSIDEHDDVRWCRRQMSQRMRNGETFAALTRTVSFDDIGAGGPRHRRRGVGAIVCDYEQAIAGPKPPPQWVDEAR
jgi:hypothetical protein